LGAGVRVRFYYSATDSTNASNALNSWVSANPGSTALWQWIKYEGDAATMVANQNTVSFNGTYNLVGPDTSGVENGVSFAEFRNITSFSTFGGLAYANTTNTPLPVNLHDFTATLRDQCASVRLDWSTDQEQNSKDFTVQRSRDGSSWTDIGAVAAAGNSSVRRNYGYTDVLADREGVYFYRLGLNDLDGTRKYSKMLSVRPDCGGSGEYLVYPNPVKDHLTVEMPLTGGGKVLKVYSGVGQCLLTLAFKPGQVQTIPAGGWSKGIYLVVITENGKVVKSEKVMKE
jgi:hypothetical protein